MRLVVVAIAVILILIFVGRFVNRPTSTPGNPSTPTPISTFTPEPTPSILVATPAVTPQPSITSSQITISNFSYNPETIKVVAPIMISWTNYDPTPHTVTSDDGLFNSGPLAPGQSFSYTFDVGGTFTYHCQIEPNIHGSITVFSPLLSPK